MHKIIINKRARQSHFNNNNLAFRGQSEVIGICAFEEKYGLANKKSVRHRVGERKVEKEGEGKKVYIKTAFSSQPTNIKVRDNGSYSLLHRYRDYNSVQKFLFMCEMQWHLCKFSTVRRSQKAGKFSQHVLVHCPSHLAVV